MSDKIYVGNGKQVKDYDMVNFSVCLSDLPAEHINEFNGKKYINLTIAKKKEVDKYGKSHAVSINTFKKEAPAVKKPEASDLPF